MTPSRVPAALLAALVLLGPALPARAQDSDPHRHLLREQAMRTIEEAAASVDGVVAVAARHLETGETLALREDLVFPQGSAIKIPVLVELYRQAADGRYALTERVPVDADDMVGGSGVLQYFGDGTSALSLADLGVLMIVLSDNTATNLLIERVGMDAVNRRFDALGLGVTRLQRIMIDQAASARGDENLSTPAEAVEYLARLHAGDLLGEADTEAVLALLSRPKSSSLGRLLPPGTRVANKPGGLAGVTTEWGIVYLPRGAYAIAVMANHVVGDGAGEAVARISKVVHDYYWRLSLATPYGTRVPVELLQH